MTMQWSQHGAYTLEWRGQVLVARYEGAWNEVCARHLHRDAKRLWQQRPAGSAWGLLSDAVHWEVGTPEALQAWWEFFEDGVRNGLSAVTDVLPTQFHELMVQALAERAGRLARYRRSASVEDGLAWLQTQGLPSG